MRVIRASRNSNRIRPGLESSTLAPIGKGIYRRFPKPQFQVRVLVGVSPVLHRIAWACRRLQFQRFIEGRRRRLPARACRCRCFLRRFLRRFFVTFGFLLPRRCLEVLIGHLEIVLFGDCLAVADPLTDDVDRVRLRQLVSRVDRMLWNSFGQGFSPALVMMR